MNLEFYKYQGTGNDFIIVDNRSELFPKKDTKINSKISKLCERHFGIGADGLILLEKCKGYDFNMVYYNSDGREGTMCGNGGRCTVDLAKYLKIFERETTFLGFDGVHHASVEVDNKIKLQMKNVQEVKKRDGFFLDTGSPHYVVMVDDIYNYPVKEKGRIIAHLEPYGKKGTNVNFVEQNGNNSFFVRTYERGVEDETLSCGTGVVASAISMFHAQQTKSKNINIITRGGHLNISFKIDNNGGYHSIFLKGAVEKVYQGHLFGF
ncbi:diaminopimelate epimerase [Elysia marginata]|uniref:Diaminopimelate epimerase n=1 Tax=Elysia marginata TaxID=1093978 RepID=A0AAV4ELE2_9GAST|nr:diaminopimelate epimerase [Elysia marginata]